MFIPRANREVVQHALNRGNALMVTSVEIGFAFGAESTVSATCQAILSAATLWNSLTRFASYQLQFLCLLQSVLSTQACKARCVSRTANLPVCKSSARAYQKSIDIDPHSRLAPQDSQHCKRYSELPLQLHTTTGRQKLAPDMR